MKSLSAPVLRMISVVLLAQASVSTTLSEDWPQWRGPGRNGISRETGLLKEWPAEGPKLLWQLKDLGEGFSTPSVSQGRLYVVSNNGAEDEFVQARNVEDGKVLWTASLGKVGPNTPQMNYGGSRSTPTLDGAQVYVLSSDGELVCLESGNGKVVWKKNIRTEFGGKPGAWAYAESPLVDGENVICTPGGADATVVAFDKKNGAVRWKAALPEGDEAGYASAIVVETAGVRQYVQLLQKGLVGLEAKSGKLLWRFNKPVSRFNANIPSPTFANGYVYAGSAGTGGGAVLLKAKADGVEAEPAYFEAKLPTTIGGVVVIGEYLYGTTAQAMLCAEFKTGQLKWEDRAIGAGSMCVADGRIYLHGENGQMALIEPSPAGYREKGRFTPPDAPKYARQMQKAWAYPVVSNGRLYIRDVGALWCYSVR